MKRQKAGKEESHDGRVPVGCQQMWISGIRGSRNFFGISLYFRGILWNSMSPSPRNSGRNTGTTVHVLIQKKFTLFAVMHLCSPSYGHGQEHGHGHGHEYSHGHGHGHGWK